MSDPEGVLEKIQQRLAEKDEVINEQMVQIVDLEDRVEQLEKENGELKHAKAEYDRIRKQLDALLKG